MKRKFADMLTASLIFAAAFAAAPALAQTSDIAAEEFKTSPGKTLVSIPWGTDENSVGKASVEEGVHSFISPTSFIARDEKVYVLDSPNFRIFKINTRTGSIEARAALEEKVSGEVMLYTDMAFMPQNFIAVASSREKMIYLFTPDLKPAGKIKPDAPVGMITKISVDDRGMFLIEDPVAEKIFVTDSSGKLAATAPIECQPVILRDGRLARFEIAESSKPPFKVTATLFAPGADPKDPKDPKNAQTSKYEFEFDKPVQNLILLGEAGRALHVYAVLGAAGDVPVAARAVKISPTGKIIGSLDVPISPSMTTMAYVRESDGGNVLFARGTDDGYAITQYSYKK